MKMPATIPDNLLAPCGLNCMLCHHHCESDDPCSGCREGKGKSKHCRECEILACAKSKGLSFCAYCTQFPCTMLTDFNKDVYIKRFGHEFLPNALLLKEQGKTALIDKLCEDWKCPDCGGVICIHDNHCTECGKTIVF